MITYATFKALLAVTHFLHKI